MTDQKNSFARAISPMPSAHPVSMGLPGAAIWEEIAPERQDSSCRYLKGSLRSPLDHRIATVNFFSNPHQCHCNRSSLYCVFCCFYQLFVYFSLLLQPRRVPVQQHPLHLPHPDLRPQGRLRRRVGRGRLLPQLRLPQQPVQVPAHCVRCSQCHICCQLHRIWFR